MLPSACEVRNYLMKSYLGYGLAKRTRKSDASFRLAFITNCVSFGHPLALTCDDFVGAQFRTQIDASFHRLATQHKSTQVDRKWTVYAWKSTTFLQLAWTCEPTLRRANPFGHPSQVLVLQTCVDLRVRLARVLGPAWRRVFHAHYSINELLLYEKYAVWTIKFAWIRCIIQLWYRRRFKRRISHAPCIMHDFECATLHEY